LDARYEKLRINNVVTDCAVLQAVGINEQGRPEHLGLSISPSEAEIHWRDFLLSLTKRGLSGVELVISDSHKGLKEARKRVFGSVPWQRCIFHLQQSGQSRIKSRHNKEKAAQWIREILGSFSKQEALNKKT
jgi:putative transposase